MLRSNLHDHSVSYCLSPWGAYLSLLSTAD
jgi:hypothetical protein